MPAYKDSKTGKWYTSFYYTNWNGVRECGTRFIKDGKEYKLQTKDLCSQARKAGIDFIADR